MIFDECTSGYRENMGGIHLKFNVNPDIAIFGKALGSGYAINAIIGKKSVMQKLKILLLVVLFGVKELDIMLLFFNQEFKDLKYLKKLKIMENLLNHYGWSYLKNIKFQLKSWAQQFRLFNFLKII